MVRAFFTDAMYVVANMRHALSAFTKCNNSNESNHANRVDPMQASA